ncbi:glucose-1-phosphate thymidylyltransferase, partial [Mariniblastus sp.]|nr:glucose-1-phosphate thymidylyltransferase [Mariniblastus sp.]
IVRPFLERIQMLDFPELEQSLDLSQRWTLIVNARLAPTVRNWEKICALRESSNQLLPEGILIRVGWATAAAIVPTSTLQDHPRASWSEIIESLGSRPNCEITEDDLSLLDYPHEIINQNIQSFQGNLAHRIAHGNYTEKYANVFVADGVQIVDPVLFDSKPGPIVIDSDVKIGPFCFIRGPVYVGPRTRISEHASIKDCVSISHTCKIGGEVESTILEAYTNKQHHGFLGHSYIGSWINLGAGTCNSDLKNTYGMVNMQYGSEKVASGMQFIGCIMGDYAKTAINTSIFTGKTIGTASMVYGFATTNVPSFVNYARTFDKVGNLPPEVIVTTQKRMFSRRNVTQRPCDIELILDMYRNTQHERPDGLSNEPISL